MLILAILQSFGEHLIMNLTSVLPL